MPFQRLEVIVESKVFGDSHPVPLFIFPQADMLVDLPLQLQFPGCNLVVEALDRSQSNLCLSDKILTMLQEDSKAESEGHCSLAFLSG
jgi:hypothetical protein